MGIQPKKFKSTKAKRTKVINKKYWTMKLDLVKFLINESKEK